MIESATRTMRVRPAVLSELGTLRAHLMQRVRLGTVAPVSAWDAYNDAMRQVLRNPDAFVTDDRAWFPVRCRRCGHASSVPKDVDLWDCGGCGDRGRTAFVDMLAPSGAYLVDDGTLDSAADRSHLRAQALTDGATLAEAEVVQRG